MVKKDRGHKKGRKKSDNRDKIWTRSVFGGLSIGGEGREKETCFGNTLSLN